MMDEEWTKIRSMREEIQPRAWRADIQHLTAGIKQKPKEAKTADKLKGLNKCEARREIKNTRAKERAFEKKEFVERILAAPEARRTEEELEKLKQFETRREKKNVRSKERAAEKKEYITRILDTPEAQRTEEENLNLRTLFIAKLRKNEGDRLRRMRLKKQKYDLGLPIRRVGRPAKQTTVVRKFVDV